MVIKVYTDGACSGNPGVGGWGALIIESNVVREISGFDEKTTNNRMEMIAAIEALKYLMSIYSDSLNKVIVYTDSQYLQKGISIWIKGWKDNGWKTKSGVRVKNIDLWEALDNLLERFGCDVEFVYIRGHDGNFGNEYVDKLAKSAIDNKKGIMLKCAIGDHEYSSKNKK